MLGQSDCQQHKVDTTSTQSLSDAGVWGFGRKCKGRRLLAYKVDIPEHSKYDPLNPSIVEGRLANEYFEKLTGL